MSRITLQGVSKAYTSGKQAKTLAVADASLDLDEGTCTAIVGPSGSGKTTLLKIMGTLLAPDEGRVSILGTDPSLLSDAELARFRNQTFGYVFQNYALIEDETAYDNIRLPFLYGPRTTKANQRASIERVAKHLGISGLLGKRADRLSGGEKQRVAIARATVRDQRVILADEPTGSLDSVNRELVVSLLTGLAKEHGRLVVIVTHDTYVARLCDSTIWLRDGRVQTPRHLGERTR